MLLRVGVGTKEEGVGKVSEVLGTMQLSQSALTRPAHGKGCMEGRRDGQVGKEFTTQK